MRLEVVVTQGLGDNSFVISSEGEAVVVDPQRDAGRYLSALRADDSKLRAVLETHVHNDFVSGARELAERTGAEVAAPARGGYAFDHRPLREGDEIHVGNVRLVAMETPGHTPEHLAYLVYEDGSDVATAVLTGGSLMVGGAGRTDLLGPQMTEELTRAQFRTLRRLASLPDDVQVLPTHGAGSFCGAASGPTERVSTLREERLRNDALTAADEATFVRQQLDGLLAYPAYYRRMASINRSGPRLLRDLPRPRPLSVEEVASLQNEGGWVVDARRRTEFAERHIEGAVNVELLPDFGSYVGWVVPFDARIALVLPHPEEEGLEEAWTQLVRVGYERVEGFLDGGVDAWERAGLPVSSYDIERFDEWCREVRERGGVSTLDVRQQVEWDRGHVPDSTHVFVGDLPQRLSDLPRGEELWVACATGHRASIAASLLDREGFDVKLVNRTGVEDLLRRCLGSDTSDEPSRAAGTAPGRGTSQGT